MQKTNIAKYIILILITPFFLSGCYDRFELDNLAYVIAIGADVGSGENLNISYQIAKPLKITGRESSEGKDTYTTYTVSAPSLNAGNAIVNSQLSKELNLSQIKVILYSEELARTEIKGHINELVSHLNIRPKTSVAICKGKAEDFLNDIDPKLEANPARYYELLFSSHNYTNLTAGSELIHFYTSTEALDRSAFTTYVSVEEKKDRKDAKMEGLAVFEGTNMVGVLEQELVLPHLILTNDLDKSSYTVKDFNDEKRVISVDIDQFKSPKIKVTLNGDTPHIECDVEISAYLVSSGTSINFYEDENKNRLKDELEKKLKDDINKYLEKTTKELKSDIAGIGRFAKSNFLTWDEFEKYDWLSKYPNSSYNVNVNVDLTTSQIISHFVPDASE